MPDITEYVQLGGQVVVVVLFLNYLAKRDNKWTDSLKDSSRANIILAKALQRLTDTVLKNNVVSEEGNVVGKENTGALKKNTSVIKNGK